LAVILAISDRRVDDASSNPLFSDDANVFHLQPMALSQLGEQAVNGELYALDDRIAYYNDSVPANFELVLNDCDEPVRIVQVCGGVICPA
jgi:hypothetical protein